MRRCSGVICGFGFVTNRRAGIFSDTGCAKWTKTNGYAARRTWLTTSGLIADAGVFFSPKDSIATDPSPWWTDIPRDKDFNSLAFHKCDKNDRTEFGRDPGLQSEKSEIRYDLSVPWYLFILHFFPFLKASRDPRIQGCERPWNRGYEDTIRDRQDRKISRVSRMFFFAVATSGREFVHGRTNVHLSVRDLQFNATASSRNASALSDEEGTTPTAQKKRLPLPRATLPSPCSSPRSLLILFPFANELLIDSFSS